MRLYPIASAALLLASPALAGSREDAACIVGRLSAADLAAIVEESLAGGSSEALARLTPPLIACSEGQEWTPRRRADATGYAIGIVDRTILGQRLGARGVDSAVLDRWFARQSDAFRTTAFMGMGEAEMTIAFETLAGREVPVETLEREGATIGGYLAALVIIERIERASASTRHHDPGSGWPARASLSPAAAGYTTSQALRANGGMRAIRAGKGHGGIVRSHLPFAGASG